MSSFASWDDFTSWLNGLGMFHMELGLERIRAALAALALSCPSFPIIQVLGTNGKGSCATFLSTLATSHGLCCGLFLSPHFVSIEERIKIDGRPVPRPIWLESANLLKDSLQKDQNLTYFEFLTALAILIFSRKKVDMAVLEAGLGGRNDATSAVPAKTHCITPIAMDHAAIIGPKITDIALDKTEAIQAETMVFSAPQSDPVREIIEERCKERKAVLEFVQVDPLLPQTALKGEMQKINASLAIHAWRAFSRQTGIFPINEGERMKREKEAMAKAFIPGRFQKIPAGGGLPPLILDGAHNPHAIKALLKNLKGEKPYAIIFSALADKDWPTSLELVDKAFGPVPMFIPSLDNAKDRASAPSDIAAQRNRRHPNSAHAFCGKDGLYKAIAAARQIPNPMGEPLLITGSLFLLADFFLLYPQYLESGQFF